jgi:hypothetical protein
MSTLAASFLFLLVKGDGAASWAPLIAASPLWYLLGLTEPRVESRLVHVVASLIDTVM